MRRLLTRIIPLLALCLIFSCSDNGTGPNNNDSGNDDSGSDTSGSTTGTVEIITSTGGNNQDSDGYTVTIGDSEESISASDTVTIEKEEGNYEAELSGISSNCSVGGDNPRSLDVSAEETTSTTFEVSCEAVEEGPMISSVTPQEGEVGTEVTIEGMNFSATASENTVTFSSTEASISSAAEDQLITQVPEGATDGPVLVAVGEDTAIGPEFDVMTSEPGAPTISSISPQEGELGTIVTIKGTNFSATKSENTVTFGGAEAYIWGAAEDELTAEVPVDASDGPVQVTVGDETAVGPDFDFLPPDPPTISSVTPQEGTIGTVVKIEGSNFNRGDNKITFNGTEANLELENAWDDSLITKVPEGATDGPIKVTVFDQTATGPDFNVLPPPTISSIEPLEGEVGTEVTITGTNFIPKASRNTVIFGHPILSSSVEASVISATSTEIVAEVPEGTDGGPIHVKIGGQTAEGDNFEVLVLGDMEITTLTSGSDQDFNGYQLTITKGFHSDFEKKIDVGVNETITVEDLEVDTYEIGLELATVANNCTRSVNGNSSVDIQKGQVTTHEFNVSCQTTNAFSYEGKIVYVSARDDDIRITNPNDAITHNSEFHDNNPAVSPDGEHIAFLSDRDGSYDDDDLFIMDITGENIQKIADNNAMGFQFSWSPDGTELAIIDKNEAFIINRDGSNRRFLTDNVTAVDWAPDGSEIAFGDKANPGNIKFVSTDGTELRSFSTGVVEVTDIDYSPDGSELIFTADLGDGKSGLYFVNPDGSDLQPTFSSNFAIYSDPSWSPDGSKFVYQKATHTPTSSSAVVIKDIASGDGTTLFHPADISDPFWTPALDR